MRTRLKVLQALALLMCVASLFAAGFLMGKEYGEKRVNEEREILQELNRSSIINMSAGDGVIYVIGHKSPDSDTVCSAIAYARLLEKFGFNAVPALNGEINNETKFILEQAGVDVPQILSNASGEYIFLVDHSEYLQSTDGMDEAHIVGILDHHGVGSVNTGNQVVYDARPIGATATIVWLDYLNYGLDMDDQTAYIILCAVLSDTYNLEGSTTTEADRKAVEVLSERCGVADVNALYRALHENLLSYDGFTDLEILFSDYKEYEAFGTRYGIGLVNAIDEETAKALVARMKAALKEGFASRDVGLMYVSVSMRENGQKIDYIVPVDELSKQIFELAFPFYDEYDGTAFIFHNGCGRKTVFVPGLNDFLASQPHE